MVALGPPTAYRTPLILSLIGMLALAYSLWTLVGAGPRAVGWGFVLLLAGVPVYALMREVNR